MGCRAHITTGTPPREPGLKRALRTPLSAAARRAPDRISRFRMVWTGAWISFSGMATIAAQAGHRLTHIMIPKVESVADTPGGAVKTVTEGIIKAEGLTWYQVVIDQTVDSSLMHRYGTLAEQANAILFLASDEASYITGQTVYIDGGRLALNYTVPVKE